MRLPLSMRERKQVQLYPHTPEILYNVWIQKESKLYQMHSELAAIEKAPFLPLYFEVLAPGTFYSFSQIHHIYISQKSPESYNFSNQKLEWEEWKRDTEKEKE